MAKTVTISQAEYEYMKTVIAQDGMIIARFEAELAQAKEDIKRLLILGRNYQVCEFCKMHYGHADCSECEDNAEWRGYRRDAKT